MSQYGLQKARGVHPTWCRCETCLPEPSYAEEAEFTPVAAVGGFRGSLTITESGDLLPSFKEGGVLDKHGVYRPVEEPDPTDPDFYR